MNDSKQAEQKQEKLMIAPAEMTDLPVILDIQIRAFYAESALYEYRVLPPQQETVADLLRELEKGAMLKAVIAGRIVGAVRAYQEDDTCYIGRLVVEPELQNKGIGRRLMESIESFFSCSRYELFTGHRSKKSISLYEKLGYKIYREVPVDDNLRLVYLEKSNSQIEEE